MKRTGLILLTLLVFGLLLSSSIFSKNFFETPILSEAVDYFYFSLILKLRFLNNNGINSSLPIDNENYFEIANINQKDFFPSNSLSPCFKVNENVRCYLFGLDGESAFYYSVKEDKYYSISPLPFFMSGLEAEYHKPTNSIYLMGALGNCRDYMNLSALECLSQFWRYDVSTDSYEKMPDMPRGWELSILPYPIVLGNCHAERGISAIFDIDGYRNRIYHIGGQGRCRRCDYFDIDKNKWYPCADFPEANGIEGGVYGVINNKLYTVGGQSSIHINHAWSYDPITDFWEVIPDPPHFTIWSFGGAMDNKLHIIKGRYGGSRNTINIHYIYDPSEESWKEVGPSPYPKKYVGSTGIWENCIYLFGGIENNGNITSQVQYEKYCEDTESK